MFQYHKHHKVQKIKGIQTRGPLKMCEKLGNSKNRSSKNPGNLKWFLRQIQGTRKIIEELGNWNNLVFEKSVLNCMNI